MKTLILVTLILVAGIFLGVMGTLLNRHVSAEPTAKVIRLRQCEYLYVYPPGVIMHAGDCTNHPTMVK